MEQLKAQLTEEQLEELKKQGITPEEYIAGMVQDLEYGEEGEEENDDQDGDEKDDDADDGDAEKRAKTE